MAKDQVAASPTRMLPVGASAFAGLQDEPILITVPKAARLLGISRSAAYRCAASGELPTTHLGGRVYVLTAKLQQVLESA